jgi:hypothetical protein
VGGLSSSGYVRSPDEGEEGIEPPYITEKDLAGQVVRTLVDRAEVAGGYQVWWEVASGMYLVWLEVETFTQTRKMVLLR